MLGLGGLYTFYVLSDVSCEGILVLFHFCAVYGLDYGLVVYFLGIYVYYVFLLPLLLALVFLSENTCVVLFAQLIQMFLVFFCKVEVF